MKWSARLLVAVLSVALCGQARAECIDAPDLAIFDTMLPEDYAQGATRSDRLGRVVAPVSVNGQGPFRFIVDTGANRSVLSESLAAQLGLVSTSVGDVHSVYGITQAPLVEVDSLQYSDVELRGASLPILRSTALAGEHGLLGVDGMRGRRLLMDFDRDCIEIAPSRGARRLANWTRVRGELRFGHLVTINGFVNRVPVTMFLDTGSNFTMANFALRDRLREQTRIRARSMDPVSAYTAGEPVVLDTAMALPRVDLGQLEASNILAYVGDFHIFRLWNLTEEPALLLGMDLLAQTRGIAIDYERAIVHFRLHTRPRTGSRVSGASQPGVSVGVDR
jgi:predicted aspartyl protease